MKLLESLHCLTLGEVRDVDKGIHKFFYQKNLKILFHLESFKEELLYRSHPQVCNKDTIDRVDKAVLPEEIEVNQADE